MRAASSAPHRSHPQLTLAFATANEQRGATVRIGGREVTFVATDDAPLASAELVFSALPHGASKDRVERAAKPARAQLIYQPTCVPATAAKESPTA